MKKLYTFLAITAFTAIAANAQSANLIENGGFETWKDGVPTNFEPFNATGISSNNFVTQENTIVHGGTSSLRHTSQATTQSISPDLITIVPGHSYTISYWYYDNSTTAKTRIWSAWLDSDNKSLTQDANVLALNEDTQFSVDKPEWVQKTLTLTAPATAVKFRFQARTNREAVGADGGYVYYDDFSFIDNNGTAGVNQNQISNLKLFPNPLTGNVLNIATNNSVEKSVAVFDVLGKQVLNTKTVNGTVNAANLTAGVYIVKITEEGKTATRKLIVQ